jgi:hypothetical protein
MLHLTGKPAQVITQGHHGHPDRRTGTPIICFLLADGGLVAEARR